MMAPGTRTTAIMSTAAGAQSTVAASSTRTSAGDRQAATVGARKVWRYSATRSAPSVSRDTLAPERDSAARAGPRAKRWSSRRLRIAPSCSAALERAIASTMSWPAQARTAAAAAIAR